MRGEITRTVGRFIEQHHLLSKGDKVLVTLSGGSDSVALLLLLQALGYDCMAAHCNFNLRGEESLRDQHFVENLCAARQTSLKIASFDTESYAKEKGLSIEMAARELRYDWFESLMKEYGTAAIAVAHHRDDSVETILLNLIRGTGINGLTGIHPRNGHIVRPLLCLSRQQILDYLEANSQEYVTDSSNLKEIFTRNKIRLQLLPLMEEINPSVKEGLQRTGNYLSEVSRIYQSSIDESLRRVKKDNTLSIPALKKEISPLAILFETLSPLGFHSAQIQEICDSMNRQSGKIFIAEDYRVVKDRDCFIIEEIYPHIGNVQPPFEILYSEIPYSKEFVIPKGADKISIDADKVKGKLYLRKWEKGDRFTPFGMKGSKLVSDYLTDIKRSIIEKERQWLLCCDNGIVWVVGLRIDNHYRVDANSRRIIVAELK